MTRRRDPVLDERDQQRCAVGQDKALPEPAPTRVLGWNKIRWRCREDYCERASFTEAIAQVLTRARTTGRLRAQIGAAIGDAARSVTEVADAHGVRTAIRS